MKKVFSLIGDIVTILLVVVAVLLTGFLIKAKVSHDQVPSIMGYKMMTVLSGSMRPLMEPGDMILIKPIDVNSITNGTIITYQMGQGTFVTHRVIKIDNRNGKMAFKTKGDANNVEDESVVLQEQVIGTMALRLPYGGYIAQFIRTPIGLAILVFIVVVIISAGPVKRWAYQPKADTRKPQSSK